MYLGDNLVGEPVRQGVERFREGGADALILLKAVDDPRQFGVAEVDGAGRVLRLVEEAKQPPSNLALVGVYCFSAAVHSVIEHLKPSWWGELKITDAIQGLINAGRRVQSPELRGWWQDTGKKDELLGANRVVLEEWVRRQVDGEWGAESRIEGRVLLEAGAVVEGVEWLEDSLIGRNALVRRGAANHRALRRLIGDDAEVAV